MVLTVDLVSSRFNPMLVYQVLGPVDGGGVSADVRVEALQ